MGRTTIVGTAIKARLEKRWLSDKWLRRSKKCLLLNYIEKDENAPHVYHKMWHSLEVGVKKRAKIKEWGTLARWWTRKLQAPFPHRNIK